MADSARLVFRLKPPTNGRLLFGLADGQELQPPGVELQLHAQLPGMTLQCDLAYASNTERPLVAASRVDWQSAAQHKAGVLERMQGSVRSPAGWQGRWQAAQARPQAAEIRQAGTLRPAKLQTVMRHQDGLPLHASAAVRAQIGLSINPQLQAGHQSGEPVQKQSELPHQDGLRDRLAERRSDMQSALPLVAGVSTDHQTARPWLLGFAVRYQEAVPPPPGISKRPGPPVDPEPPVDRCYVPDPRLLFKALAARDGRLIFVCEHAIAPQPQFVIPLLPVYMQVHHLTAHLLPSLEPVVLTDVTIAADDDSYCWSLFANGPEHLLDQLAPVGGLPQRLQVGIDGMQFVFAVTSTARSRSFDRRRVAVQGISVTAMLGSPYMPKQAWLSSSVATAQQLAVSALEFSGVDLDWQIPDWQVPAGAWSFQGTPLQAVLRMAQSVNAVVRSHRTAEQLIVAPRYPVLPWEWGAAVPDVQMPAAVIVTDELRPDPRAEYNAIYVAGGSVGGVLGHVVRSLSARDKLAPQIQDDLITHADAARMRGSWALAASGNKLQHSISMPVLTGSTNPGILNPGQLLEVADTDGTWRGLVRGVSVSASMPRVRQQVTVERIAA